jgi:uncharacterized protein (TIGR00661 family)
MMKILYAIQGTGNGHLARATEIVPILKEIAETDVLVSGTQSDIHVPFRIDYRFKGISFILDKHGGVDFFRTMRKMSIIDFFRDIRSLPVRKYDLVISEFEPVSSWACRLKNKTCIGLSHQNAVLHSSAPKPEFRDLLGEMVLKHYAPATFKYGFNFKPSFPDIFPPVIRPAIRHSKPKKLSHFVVYLPAYSDQQILDVLSRIHSTEWQVFSKHSRQKYSVGNVHFQPVSLENFTVSFVNCTGILCTAGFEGPAEAIFMGKKLCVIPMKNQYEQYCNAAYLKSLGIKILENFSNSSEDLAEWINSTEVLTVKYPDLTRGILLDIMNKHVDIKTIPEYQAGMLI